MTLLCMPQLIVYKVLQTTQERNLSALVAIDMVGRFGAQPTSRHSALPRSLCGGRGWMGMDARADARVASVCVCLGMDARVDASVDEREDEV